MEKQPKTKMTIVYSPHYDGEVFLGDKPEAIGTLYVGTKGLMDFLEQRAGVHFKIKADVEREADYFNAMKSYIADEEAIENTSKEADPKNDSYFFRESVKVDPFGVARKLLNWRDNLFMAGWDGTCSDSLCKKMIVLSKIEKHFQSSGIPDCWRKLYEIYRERDVLGGLVGVFRFDSAKMDIPGIVDLTLQSIFDRKNVTVETNYCQQVLDVSKIRLLEFHDVNEAYEWIAQVEKFPDDTAIVNRDNIRLNHTLSTWDMPLVGSTLMQSNPQLLQLFKLSMGVFSRPLNINNLLSYLQLPMSPIPGGLRYKLARILLKNGGFGEIKLRDDGKPRDDWDDAIATFEFKDKTPKYRSTKLSLLKPIRADYHDDLKREELVAYIRTIRDWANGYNAGKELPEERKRQLAELDNMYQSLDTALKSEEESIKYADVEKLIYQIYRPMNYSLQQAESGSLNVIHDVRAMVKPAKTLIWLDCQQDDMEADPYDFLSEDERNYLSRHLARIPDFSQLLEHVRNEKIYKLNEVEQVILVRSAYDGTTRLGEHSIVAEANYLSEQKLPKVKAEELFPMKETRKEKGAVDIYQPSLAYEIGKVDFKGRKESYSSIDELISFPFNYVMDHVALLPMPEEEQLKNTYTTTGLVAHHFFQHIIEDGHQDLSEMRRLIANEFDQRLETAIDVTGLILRLDENATALNSFRSHLRESMLALIDIMETKKLTPVACEINIPEKENEVVKLDTIKDFGARIDLLLKDVRDQFVVFDFKWSYSKQYTEKLEAGQSIQLELYRQAVIKAYENKNVTGVGYYLMPRKQLITTDFDEIPGKNLIRHIDKPAAEENLKAFIEHSFDFRMEEIRKGHIEEAEMMDILQESDSYYAHQNDEDYELLPLKVNTVSTGRGRNREITAVIKESEKVFRPSKKPTYDDKKKSPAEIATSHPVLKGRLK